MSFAGKLGWAVSAVLALVVGYGGWVLVFGVPVVPGSDGRISVHLSQGERDKVLGEMRFLLETVQAVIEATAQGDMATVETAARRAGMAAAQGESPAMMAKLPLEFKTLGLATHQAFDDLADLASLSPEPLDLLAEMGNAMLNCTACHAAYRFDVESP